MLRTIFVDAVSDVVDIECGDGRLSPRVRLRVSSWCFGYAVLVTDLMLSGGAGVVAHRLYCSLSAGVYGFRSDLSAFLIGLCAGLLYVIPARFNGFYLLPSLIGTVARRGSIVLLVSGADILVAAILFIIRAGPEISRGTFLFFAPLQLACLVASRASARSLASALSEKGCLSGPSVIVVGDEGELARVNSRMLLSAYGFREVGRIAISEADPIDEGLLQSVFALTRRCLAERVVVSMRWGDEERLARLRGGLRRSALPATLLPDAGLRRLIGDRIGLAIERQPPAIELQSAAISRATLLLKRCIDVVLASAALLLLSPLLLLTAVAIKLDSRGPAIFRQRRHGFDRRPFFIYKFRSMSVAEDGPLVVQARRADHRVTRIGRLIRRSSIDELPQLVNVLKGDMSLVGPRPHAVAHDDAYTATVDRYASRHHVRPGLTGWAQINGARGETVALHQMQRRIDLDLWYIDHFSIWLDLVILCRTCFEVLKNDAF